MAKTLYVTPSNIVDTPQSVHLIMGDIGEPRRRFVVWPKEIPVPVPLPVEEPVTFPAPEPLPEPVEIPE